MGRRTVGPEEAPPFTQLTRRLRADMARGYWDTIHRIASTRLQQSLYVLVALSQYWAVIFADAPEGGVSLIVGTVASVLGVSGMYLTARTDFQADTESFDADNRDQAVSFWSERFREGGPIERSLALDMLAYYGVKSTADPLAEPQPLRTPQQIAASVETKLPLADRIRSEAQRQLSERQRQLRDEYADKLIERWQLNGRAADSVHRIVHFNAGGHTVVSEPVTPECPATAYTCTTPQCWSHPWKDAR